MNCVTMGRYAKQGVGHIAGIKYLIQSKITMVSPKKGTQWVEGKGGKGRDATNTNHNNTVLPACPLEDQSFI